MRIHYYQFPESAPESLREQCDIDERTMSCKLSYAKKMIRQYGGIGWTEHCERDGSPFEVTPITLTGNNSRFTYNHHL